ncbi:hypothetical protein RESH_00771 [Rhodopirellula europaea SH398]|uniref:Uncharacterized protein n=1 Tax=Rhodopirellula europaea SH398 TaxID=1263868 RepID=M5SQX1_9BACT|nr:hypothetical protein RESH_00771 [Rhodopirellula europaea SH398]
MSPPPQLSSAHRPHFFTPIRRISLFLLKRIVGQLAPSRQLRTRNRRHPARPTSTPQKRPHCSRSRVASRLGEVVTAC